MDDLNSAKPVPVAPSFPLDGEPRDINGVLSIGWEVKDDYGNVVARQAWENGVEWSDPYLAPIAEIEPLREKALAARRAALSKVAKLTAADIPLEPEESTQEDFIPVPEHVTELWDNLGLVLTEKGSPVNNMDNVVRVLEGLPGFKGRIWLDEFTRNVMTTFCLRPGEEEREWTDEDSRQLWLEIQRRISICRIGKDTVHEAVMAYAHFNRRHPVKEWLAKIEWDRAPRLDNFFRDYMSAEDSAFNRACSSNFFLAMIARVFAPGCKVDNMVVLEGNQGRFKSSALKALCGKWFTECNEPISNGSNKDFYAILQGKMLVEIAELDSFSRADILRIKAIITTATDRYRPAYGRIAQNFPRTSVFVGTTNEEEYLADATGGRRFWPVRTGLIRLDEIARDRDQLFAEALHRYRVKPIWWEVPGDEAALVQESRRKEDPWEPILETWLSLPRMIPAVTSQQLAGEAIKVEADRMDRYTMMRIAYCMKALGYKMKVTKEKDKSKRVWVRE
jgi:predicted P-loop ATPase